MRDESRDDVTQDTLLGGRLVLRQPRRGHRAGHDAVLLAAATDARPGERVLDLFAGIGAAGLTLAFRVPGVDVTLIELDPALVRFAQENIAANGLAQRVRALALDVEAPPREFSAAGIAADAADRVLMNPPFHDPQRQRPSPDPARRRAHTAPRERLPGWIDTAARLLRPAGVLTMIWRADGLADLLAALAPRFGGAAVLPVHPRADAAAIRVLVSVVKSSRAPLRLVPALVLNDEDGRPTAAAEAVLRENAALRLSI